ncbi:MAG: ATP-binding protein [Armatimonadota bacterium]
MLIGGAATGDELSALCLLLPLISGAVQGEMAEVRAAGHAATARHVAEQAEGLAQALDVARRNLEGALREARDADRRKNEFLAMLGHELRNPLAPVLSALEVMRSLGTSDPALSRAREVIERQVHSLTRLVDDLLDVSRITRGKIELRKASVELVQVIRHAVETSQPLIQSRDHHLTLELPDEPLWLSADAARLEQILANLLNNAAKYTPDGGEICVIAKRVGGLAEVRIRDNGIGIPRELLPSIFEIFVQQERSLDRAQGGLGLGLALVKNLVQMHGGDVEARSEGRGRGSEFIVRLPMLPAVPELDAMPLETLHRPKSPLRVLVVDDNRDAAVTMGDLLELWDHEVSLAFDGLTALERARELAPDVVLLDIGLPGMDGYEVARRLRSEGYSEMLLIALTGYGQEEDRRRALEVGFDQHMTKPVDPDALKSALRSRGCNLRSSGPEG